jgi:hypothetical protein
VTFNGAGQLVLPVTIATSSSGAVSYLATWTAGATEIFNLPRSLTSATSLAWAGSSRLLVMSGSGLVDVALASPLANSTAVVSYLETSGTQQHAVAITSTGEPRLVINHGSGLESVWPHAGTHLWDRWDLGVTDSGRIDAVVDSNGDTRACFFRAGKLLLY